jgi:hypothetical protein
MTNDNSTAMHGGSDPNDVTFNDGCPQGGPVIGYAGYVDTRAPVSVGRIATLCGKVAVQSSPSGCRAVVSAASTLPMRGDIGDSAFTQLCPTGQVVIGFAGRSGVYLDQVGFECAPLVLSSSRAGYVVSIGAATPLTPAGGNGGTAFQDACPAGQVARGTNVAIVDQIVEAIGLSCGSPAVVSP